MELPPHPVEPQADAQPQADPPTQEDPQSSENTSEYDAALARVAVLRRRLRSQTAARRAQQEAMNLDRPPADEGTPGQRCWICFGDGTDGDSTWVRACGCSLRVHEPCLLRWIDEAQRTSPVVAVACPQCKTPYDLGESSSSLLYLLAAGDRCIRSSIPLTASLFISASTFFTAATYGSFALMLVCGGDLGGRILSTTRPWGWRVWFGIPTIPIALIMSRTSRGGQLLPLLAATFVPPSSIPMDVPFRANPRLSFTLLPLVRTAYMSLYHTWVAPTELSWDILLGDALPVRTNRGIEERLEVLFRGWKDAARFVLGALLMPVFASQTGSLLAYIPGFARKVTSHFDRSLIGACVFVVAKDVINLLYKYERVSQRRARRIRPFSSTTPSFKP